ncbi:MAG TPA: phosphatidylserine decarboxylase [Verrucomicrobiae bacterium]|nr:phosphatidylserine decarboxylase [Verrucomicrobiae bacterium]
MTHEGKAMRAGLKLIGWALVILLIVLGIGVIASLLGNVIVALATLLLGLWVLFALFSLYFFRDPTPQVPQGAGLVVSPGHGKVDVVDETTEPEVMGGKCKRVSIFLSVFDVHVQNAPIAGRVSYFKHTAGQFLNAMRTDCADFNENVLLGFESPVNPVNRVGIRLIAGLIARRIVPWVKTGDTVERGGRISLIQFGSRVNIYLPLDARVRVQPGDRAVGGETIIAEVNQ